MGNEKPKMLVVDDSNVGRAIITSIFQTDYSILEAADGTEALELLRREEQIKVVLLDIQLPVMSGFDVFKLMNKEEKLRKIPVLVTADSADDEAYALQLGAADFVKKPYNAEVLKQRVDRIVNGFIAERERLEDDVLKAYEIMQYRAEHDALTGICNRESFYEKTKTLILKNQTTSFVIGRWNVERFKVINDLFGTEAGDIILRGISEILRETLHGVGSYARLEADHFVFCYPESYTTPEELLEKSEQKFKKYQQNYKVVCSMGLYKVEDFHLPIERMCDRANLALSTIKGNYTRRFAYYDENLRRALLREQTIIGEMDYALKMEQFEVYLQPIFSPETNKTEAAEALIRWNSPVMGTIQPDEFIPLFERNGFITKLDYYIWEKTCAYIHNCIEQKKPVVPISVNVSRINLYNEKLCEEIRSMTERYQIPRTMLRLEITESAYMDNPRQLMETTKELRENGFKILMDDFGSGYSSLSMLAELPVDILKIDMHFIDDLDTSHRAGSVITSVIRMAKWLDIGIIAEGVETKTQLEFLQMVGCECVQGFYYARPMQMKEFDELLMMKKPAVLEREIDKLVTMRGGLDTESGVNELYSEIDEDVKAQQTLYATTRELKRALEDEEMVLRCARELSSIKSPKEAINKVLSELLEHYKGDRTYIFEFDWSKEIACNTYERCAQGTASEKKNLQNVPFEAMLFWLDRFKNKSVVYISDVEQIGKERSQEAEILKAQGIHSLVAVAFYSGEQIVGFIGVDNPTIRGNSPHIIKNLTYFIANEIEKDRMQKKLEYLSFHDVLTGLYNRNRYAIYTEVFNAVKNRDGAGIVYLDVNGLKRTNDSKGHNCGDMLIKETAQKMKAAFSQEMLFRLSGDEFLIVADQCMEHDFMNKVQALKKILIEKEVPLASCGYVWQKNPKNIEELVNAADIQMYEDKKSYYETRILEDRRH